MHNRYMPQQNGESWVINFHIYSRRPWQKHRLPVKPFLTKNSFFHPFRVNPDLNNFCALSYNARVLVGSACSRRSVGKTNCHGETAQ